ncbi:MAG: Fe-S cluster assembly ATPase SufC [Bacteroidetes bacterium]|nr:Fe-S cluster assembly ATPase SufC [Bacteroidota bacterium]
MLQIKNLHANVDGIEILKGINLEIKAGEVHAIMGPNGSGKSTLSKVIAGHPAYEVTEGEILFEGTNIEDLDADERARMGIFLAFQYPVEIPGVSNSMLMRQSYNAMRREHGEEELDPLEFDDYVRGKLDLVEMDPKFLDRSVNDGFSGGEKKRNEILQMAVLNPKMALLDETDSGLDIDALRIVSDGINKIKSKDKGVLLVTHYQRILNYITPDFVHVLKGGRIVKSGGKELAHQLEDQGYEEVVEAK